MFPKSTFVSTAARFALALGLAGQLLTGEARAQGVLGRFMADGRQGFTSYCDSTRCSYLDVSENALLSQPQAFLWLYTFDFSSGSFTFGYGAIPSSSLSGGGVGELRLDLDTSAVSTFALTSCSWSPYEYVCETVPGGPISIRLVRNGFSTSRTSGATSYTYGSYRVTMVGSSEGTSASATGTILGWPIAPGAYAGFGEFHQMSLTVSQGP